MILVASLSRDLIFETMRRDSIVVKGKENVSLYRIFVSGIFLNIILEIALLSVSLLVGGVLQMMDFDIYTTHIEFSLILILLISSTTLFFTNMERIVSVMFHTNR